MNSKEQAEHLFLCYFNELNKDKILAKKIELITVDEILKNCYEVMKPFFKEVKQEIELL